MADASYRIEVLHGVNLDMLGHRDPAIYGTLTLPELQARIEGFAAELGLRVRFFQTQRRRRADRAPAPAARARPTGSC